MNATALILIDLQRGMLPESTGPRNNPQAEDNAAHLLHAWRVRGLPVVHVRHMSRSPEGSFWPGSSNCEFQPRFEPLPSEHRLEKNVPDAFAGSGLERWLRPLVSGSQRRSVMAWCCEGTGGHRSLHAARVARLPSGLNRERA